MTSPLSTASLGTALLALFASSSALALQPQTSEHDSRPNLAGLLTEWRAENGSSWHTFENNTNHFAEMIYGGKAAAPFPPITEGDWLDISRHWIQATYEMHGIDGGTLSEGRSHFLPLGLAHGGTDKMTVRFEQHVNGVPVIDGAVNVLMTTTGDLLSVQVSGTPFTLIDTQPSLAQSMAVAIAERSFLSATGERPTQASAAQLVIHQVDVDGTGQAFLAWEVEVHYQEDGFDPAGKAYYINAHGSEVLDVRERVHNFDVGGTVSTMASPGTLPDKSSNPDAALPAAYIRITSTAGTIFADVNGNWNYPGISGPLDVTVTYRGEFNNVQNQAGSNYSLTTTASTGTGNNILMNPTGTSQNITAQSNAYLHVAKVRDMIRAADPGDSTADFLALSKPNISSTCNAFFDGSSINFYQAGGGCINTAYSTVVAHELGHWLNVRYGTGNGSDGMGEGNADVFAMYTYDNAIVGQDFCGTGCHIRNGNNNRQFCGDSSPGCHGGVHANGEVWMGAAWKVRQNLNTSLGGAVGDATANVLFVGWLNAYNQSQIKSIIETQWLVLDDDDGNIDNGTPNHDEIDAGFLQQGFPGHVIPAVDFAGVTQLGDTLDETGPYIVDATITALFNPPIQNSELHYSVDGGALQTLAMTHIGSDVYRVAMPGNPSPSIVEYFISAEDAGGLDGETDTLSFRIGLVTEFMVTDFEAAGSEGWTSGDASDTATTGIWTRNNPRGTAAQTEDDHTSAPGDTCWFTGQGSVGGSLGEQDVDNGPTTLKSPIFDAAGLFSPRISYWRWYSNNTGSSADDIFRIFISNNSGSNWTQVEQIGSGAQAHGGWYKHEFEISSIIGATATMQLKFVATDEGSGSIVEAAIDDIEGFDLAPSCAFPQAFGTGKPNSLGVTPVIGYTGSTSQTAGGFALNVSTIIGGQTAVLFSGTTQVSIPFAGGTRYVGGTIVREALVSLDTFGFASVPISISAGMVGTDLNYQWWYRDPSHSDGTGIGLSDALAVTFCP